MRNEREAHYAWFDPAPSTYRVTAEPMSDDDFGALSDTTTHPLTEPGELAPERETRERGAMTRTLLIAAAALVASCYVVAELLSSGFRVFP